MQHMPLKNRPRSSRMVWARCLLRLYPASWRERYSDEMLAILEEHPPTLWALGDLFFNLCDAHLHTEIVPVRIPTMLRQLHSNVATIFCACLLFCMIAEGNTFAFAINNFFSTGSVSIFTELTYKPYQLAIMVALLLLLIFGGVPLLISSCWRAIRTKRIQTLFLCLTGIFSLFIAFPAGNAVDVITSPIYNSIYSFFGGEMSGLVFPISQKVTILCDISSGYDFFVCIGIWALWAGLQQSTPTTRLTKFTSVPAILIPLFMFAYMFERLSFLISLPAKTILVGDQTMLIGMRPDIASLPVIMLIGWYGLLRMYQAQQTPTLKTE